MLVKASQVCSIQILSRLFWLAQVKLVQVRLVQVKILQVELVPVKLVQVKSGFISIGYTFEGEIIKPDVPGLLS